MHIKPVPPVVFLGLLDHIEEKGFVNFPMGESDLYGLSLIKQCRIFPHPVDDQHLLFLVHRSIEKLFLSGDAVMTVQYPSGKNFISLIGRATARPASPDPIPSLPLGEAGEFQAPDWFTVECSVDKRLLVEPTVLQIFLELSGTRTKIGELAFVFDPYPRPTAEELYGLKAQLLTTRSIRLDLTCDSCGHPLKTYYGLNRNIAFERDGNIWLDELPDKLRCKCGKLNASSRYLKEGLPGLMKSHRFVRLDENGAARGQERMYSYEAIERTVGGLLELITSNTGENPVQKYIEENPLLFSPFNANKLLHKPDILGKFETDFVVLDANGTLTFIEIESPSLQLFKKDGHPTAELNHAYEQVMDWLEEYKTSATQILERMGLKLSDVNAVRGFVIAGVLEPANKEHYRRHQKKREGGQIGFLTYDQLAHSVLNLARKLA